MKQVIILARCSTERQEIESQIEETKRYALSLGYNEEQFIVIAKCGASAVKLNPLYQQTIDELYKTIIEKDVEAVVVYHLNRLARNGVVAMQIKEFLIEHKTQLHVKEPSIKLLQNDGSVDSGASLCFALFAEMSQQQASELKAKTIRAKKRDKNAGLFLGGNRMYGYDIIDKRFVINKDEADVIRLIFNMYATGLYSYKTLSDELVKQGIEKDEFWVSARLNKEQYWNGTMPQIISTELMEKCEAIKQKNKTDMSRAGKHHYFANRIIRCTCGYGYTTAQKTYKCCRCNSDQISIKWIDGLLWSISRHLEGESLKNNKEYEKAVKEKQAVLGRKIKAVDNYKAKAEKRLLRAKEAYLNGIIDLAEYKAKVQADESMIKDLENEMLSYQNELELLKQPVKSSFDRVLSIADELSETDELEMRSLVRKWIKSVRLECGTVIIDTPLRTYNCKYKPKSKIGRFFTFGGRVLLIQPVERSKDTTTLGTANGNINDVMNTLAWLGGSVIV